MLFFLTVSFLVKETSAADIKLELDAPCDLMKKGECVADGLKNVCITGDDCFLEIDNIENMTYCAKKHCNDLGFAPFKVACDLVKTATSTDLYPLGLLDTADKKKARVERSKNIDCDGASSKGFFIALVMTLLA